MTDYDDHLPLSEPEEPRDELDEAFEQGTRLGVEALIEQAIREVESARAMFKSASAVVNREELLALLYDVLDQLPPEVQQARWMMKEREDYLSRTKSEADDILEAARAQAEQMVQRTEIVKASELHARKIVEKAEDEARRLRLECEDFCDQRLAQFEIVLERTMKMVNAGREKLAAPIAAAVQEQAEASDEATENMFFDQDKS